MVLQTGIYKHYKGGFYQVIGIGRYTETDERVVVYISLDIKLPGPRIQVRPLSGPVGFTTPVNGKSRFEYIGNEISK